MGNAALKQHFVTLLETNAQLLFKDLPDVAKLLELSVLGASVTLQHLEIQEQVLEHLGLFVPFEIDAARLEEVELRLSGLQLQICARRFLLRCRVRDWDKAARDIQSARPVELPRDVSGQPLLMRCLNSLNLRVQDIEIVFQMNDSEAKPWNLALLSAVTVDLPLNQRRADVRLQDLRFLCARAEQTELGNQGLILGPCDLQLELESMVASQQGDQSCRLSLALGSCPNSIRINQYQLGLFSRLRHVFVLWDVLLQSLDLHSKQRNRMKELCELAQLEHLLRGGDLHISGAFPGLELVDESSEQFLETSGNASASAAGALLRFTGSLQDERPLVDLRIQVRTEPDGWSVGGQVRISDLCIEMDGAQKVQLLDHAGEFYADIDPWNGESQSRNAVVRLGDLRLRADAEEAMQLLILLSNMFSLMLDGEADLMGDIMMHVETADEFREICDEAPVIELWSGGEPPWPKMQVSCAEPVKILLPGGVWQPMVVSFKVISGEEEEICFQLSDFSSWFLPLNQRFAVLPGPADQAWTPAAKRLLHCKSISVAGQQQALSLAAPSMALLLSPQHLALLTRHLRRWSSVRQDAAPIMEKRATLSSSFGGSSEMASPRNWQCSVKLHMPDLGVELCDEDPVLRARCHVSSGFDLDLQSLSFSHDLQGLTVWEPSSERQVLRMPQRSSLVVTFPTMEAIKEQIHCRGRLAPLWLSIDCSSFAKILDFLRELREAFAAVEGKEDVTMPTVSPDSLGLLGDWENCLQNVDLHFTCSRLSFFLPSSCTQDPKGIFLSCALELSLRQLRLRLSLRKLFAAETSQSSSVANKVDGSILHPMRCHMDVQLCTEPASITGRLEVAPISVSLKTEHVPLFLRTLRYLEVLDEELAGFGGEYPDWITNCSSPPRGRPNYLRRASTESSGELRTWRSRVAELRCVANVLQELLPVCLITAARHAAVLVNTCRLQFDVELSALHIGMVQSSTDAELAVVLVEDLLLTLDRGAAPCGFTSPRSAASPASSQGPLSPVHQGPKRREHLAGHVFVSVDITSTELARTSTLLEPVCFSFSLFEGIKRQPSSCKVSWMNLNLSSALIDTLVTLYDDATERIAGMEPFEGPSPSAPSASSSPIYEIPVNSQGRSLQRQMSISSRQPQVRVWNLLGQDITLGLLDPLARSEQIFSGSSCVVKMPWCGVRKTAQSGWTVKLQLADIPDTQVFLHLNATSAVKSVLVKPKPRTRGMGSTSTLLSSKMACYRADTSGSNLDVCYKASVGPSENWVLVRTEVGDKLHELDVHLSSVLFLENRTDLSVSVAPYGTPPEGFMELPPRSEPQPIPLDWFGQSTLWVGVTEELKMPAINSSGSSLSFGAVLSGSTDPEKRGWMKSQRRRGILQPMMGKTTWQAIRRYRSMVANDYFLRSRMLHLSDRRGESCASLCATVCGVSADLQASLQALIFSVTLEPAAQICNRLPCPMRLSTQEGFITIAPGEDADVLKPSQQLKLTLEVSPSTGVLDQEPLQLHLETAVWADRLPREKHQKRLQFSELNVNGNKEAEQMAKLTVTLETEPGLTMSEYWSPLQVRQYSPRSLRLVFFTQYWLLNRRSDCRVCLPHPELGATARGAGMAKFWSRRPGGGARLSLMQYDCNTLRMVSENLVRRGKIRVGLCDQRYNANGESLVPVTEPIRINQPTVGSATAPRTAFNPVQRCFGYTVRPAPLPFYRTLLVEVVRRYTLLNHKEHVLYCFERDACLAPLELSAGAWASFDPQGANLHIAITGIASANSKGPSGPTVERRYQKAATISHAHSARPVPPLSPKRRAVTWADIGEEEVDLEVCEQVEQQEFFSAPFVLAESSRRSFQLMHLCDLSLWEAGALERGIALARPEPLLGATEPAVGIGRAWCLTQVETLVEQSSVVVRFSEPLRPQFRILNRTGHSLGLRQDCENAPAFELAPEQRMSFCWFQPEGPLRLRLRLGSQEISYEVGTVQEHSPPLRVERALGPCGGTFAGVVREEFLVQTKVSRGSREVHIHPHCLLKNFKGHALLVRSSERKGWGTEMVVPHEGSVCVPRESKASEQVALELASCIPGSSHVPHWSAPIMLTKSLAGHRGFLRHMKSGGNGMTSVFEITMVDVKKDPISDFLVVELRPYVKANCPYFFENDSRQVCSVSQLEGPEASWAPLDLFPGESAPFVPVGAVIGGQGTFHVRLAVLGANDEIEYSTVMDIELPQEAVFGSMHVKVLKERPRHVILRDVKDVKAKVGRKGLKQSLPPFLFLQRVLGGTKPQRKISLSPRRPSPLSPRRRVSRLTSPTLSSPGSPRKRRPTLPLQMLGGTPRLSAMPSSRSLGSKISRMRRGSLDIFWTIQGRKRSYRLKGMVFELVAQGAGVTLVDSTSLNEVAYLCADTLVVDVVRYEGAGRELEMKLGSLQLDVHDHSAGWRSNVMLRPKRSRLPVRAVRERPFLLCSAHWLALDRGAGPAAHFEVDSLKIDMQPIELRLDTLSSFQLAIFALDLLRRAEPLLGAAESFGHLRRLLKTHWRSDGEQLLLAKEGLSDDPVLGEPPCPEYDDFDVPTPVFIKKLIVRRIQCFVSVRFNGKASAAGDCNNEALHAVDIVLRKLIPFDVSQARLSLGPFFRCRPGTVAPTTCRRLRRLLFGEPGTDAFLADEFLPHGFHELVSEATSAASNAVLRQIPQLLGAQRVLGSPAHLCTELGQAAHLAVFGLFSFSPWLLMAALLTVIAAILESVEGIFMIIAKTTCRITAGTVPTGLRKEPSGFPGALMDLLWYGFPWHVQQIYRECRRQSHIAYSANSLPVSLWCLLAGTWYCLFSILSSAMVIVAKLFQALQLLCHTLAWYVCPERIAELGAPLSRRVGPLLFHLGSPLQYSHLVTSTMAVVHTVVRGTRLRDWRLQHLPGNEGTLLAVQGSGFFLVRSSAIMACVPAREADVHLAWQAKGNWQRVELLRLEGKVPFLLCFHGDKAAKVLRLRSRRAALMAFSFAQECVSSWAKIEMTRMAPETPKSRLLRKVHRSAAVRASG